MSRASRQGSETGQEANNIPNIFRVAFKSNEFWISANEFRFKAKEFHCNVSEFKTNEFNIDEFQINANISNQTSEHMDNQLSKFMDFALYSYYYLASF